jgi:hypothetical protein
MDYAPIVKFNFALWYKQAREYAAAARDAGRLPSGAG